MRRASPAPLAAARGMRQHRSAQDAKHLSFPLLSSLLCSSLFWGRYMAFQWRYMALQRYKLAFQLRFLSFQGVSSHDTSARVPPSLRPPVPSGVVVSPMRECSRRRCADSFRSTARHRWPAPPHRACRTVRPPLPGQRLRRCRALHPVTRFQAAWPIPRRQTPEAGRSFWR